MIEKILEKFGYCKFEDIEEEVKEVEKFTTFSYRVFLTNGAEFHVRATHQKVFTYGDLLFTDENTRVSKSLSAGSAYFKKDEWKFFVIE